jgi:hypothetical protein
LGVQAIARQTEDFNFELREVLLSCNDDQFNQLIAAINAISIAGAGGCGCGPSTPGPIRPPSPPAVEGEPPPPGSELPTDSEGVPVEPGDPAYQTRKCKVDNLIHFQTVAIIDKIRASAFLTWTAEVYGFALTQLQLIALSYILGELATPWPLVDGIAGVVIGFYSGLLDALLGETDMEALALALDELEQELVCALYTGRSAVEALDNYVTVLNNNGVSFGNQHVIVAVMVPRLLNLAFFKEIQDEEIENAIAEFVATVDCDLCDDCPVFYSPDDSWVTWDSVDASTNSGSSTGTITNKLSYTTSIAASPSGLTQSARRFIAPLTEILAAGWLPGVGARITAEVDCDGPVVVGHWIMINYVSDPQQIGEVLTIADTFGVCSITLNSDDDIASVWVVAGNTRPSGSGIVNNSGKFVSVTFCNAYM